MFRYAILLSAFACCAFGAIIPDVISPELDGRIVGGSAAAITNFPWQVSIQRYGYTGLTFTTEHICGGAVYSSYIVITAAHCLQGNIEPNSLRIQAGSATLYDPNAYIYYVMTIRNHENYNPTTMENDIALIRSGSAIYLSGNTISAIPLSSVYPSDGATAVVTGWGSTSYGGAEPLSTLQYADVKIISRSVCEGNNYGYGKKILPSMTCASSVGKDACQGDSGGPLVYAGNLVGIVSWGYGCASGYFPGVYSDVPYLRTWLISNAGVM